MDVTPLVRSDAQVIQSYAGGGFKISSTQYDGPHYVSIETVAPWTAAKGKTVKDLTLEDFQPLIEARADIDVVLLGTGEKIGLLSSAMRNALKQAGLTVEVMDTGAACRTYNVLIADGRRVVAALLPAA